MRFLPAVGMTARHEKKEGADTAATDIRKTVTASAAVSAPSSLLNKLKSHSDRKGGISNNPLSNLSYTLF